MVQRALSPAGDPQPGQARTSPHPPGHRGPRRPPGRAEGTRTAAEARSPPAERQLPWVPAPRQRRLGRSGADGEAPRPTRAHHGPCTPTAVPARPPPRLDGARAAIGAALRPARLPWRRAFVWPRRGRSAREQRPRPRRGEGEGGESGVEEREGGGGGEGERGGKGGGREEKEGGEGRSPRPAATVSPPRRGVGSAGFEPSFAADSVRPWAGHHPGSAPSHTCSSHLAVRAPSGTRATTSHWVQACHVPCCPRGAGRLRPDQFPGTSAPPPLELEVHLLTPKGPLGTRPQHQHQGLLCLDSRRGGHPPWGQLSRELLRPLTCSLVTGWGGGSSSWGHREDMGLFPKP